MFVMNKTENVDSLLRLCVPRHRQTPNNINEQKSTPKTKMTYIPHYSFEVLANYGTQEYESNASLSYMSLIFLIGMFCLIVIYYRF